MLGYGEINVTFKCILIVFKIYGSREKRTQSVFIGIVIGMVIKSRVILSAGTVTLKRFEISRTETYLIYNFKRFDSISVLRIEINRVAYLLIISIPDDLFNCHLNCIL